MPSRSLRNLIRQLPSEEDVSLIMKELFDSSDRSAAILAATLLEDSLELALLKNLPGITTKRAFRELFEGEAPLSTFSAKIKMCHALKLCDSDVIQDLNKIKDVRNAFSHTMIPITFETEEIKNCIKDTTTVVQFKEIWPPKNTKQRYIMTSLALAFTFRILSYPTDPTRTIAV